MNDLLFPTVTGSFITIFILIGLDIGIESAISILYGAFIVHLLQLHLFVSFILAWISWILQFIIYCRFVISDFYGNPIVLSGFYQKIVILWMGITALTTISTLIEMNLELLYLWIIYKYNRVIAWWNRYQIIDNVSSIELV